MTSPRPTLAAQSAVPLACAAPLPAGAVESSTAASAGALNDDVIEAHVDGGCQGFCCSTLTVALAPFGAGPLCPFCEDELSEHANGQQCAHSSCVECTALFRIDDDDDTPPAQCRECRNTDFYREIGL